MGGLAAMRQNAGFGGRDVGNGETLSGGADAKRGLEAGSRPSVAAIEGGRSVSLTPNGQAFFDTPGRGPRDVWGPTQRKWDPLDIRRRPESETGARVATR